MCSESIFIAGRYNKYQRNLSQSPWIDKDDLRIKHSVQELIEDGLKHFLQFDKSVFSSSGREDVDVRMLGKGRPFVFRIVNPWDLSTYTQKTMKQIQEFVNFNHANKIRVRNLQIVSKDGVSKHIKDGQESKTKEYRALCCCSRPLRESDFDKIAEVTDLAINQKTPIRVLHRRSLAVRCRKIHRMRIDKVKLGEFDSVTPGNLDYVFALTLVTEAGTYIKEFVHGDFGRTEPSLSTLLDNCDTDLIELDVMEVFLDWPPELIEETPKNTDQDREFCSEVFTEAMETSERNLAELYRDGLRDMKQADSMSRSAAKQDHLHNARRLFEKASDLIESLSLFSDNETIDDVATADLKYLLVPAYLAKITISFDSCSNRLQTFIKAEHLFIKFFSRIIQYGLGNASIEQACKLDQADKTTDAPVTQSLELAMQNRNVKIERFKKMKLLDSRLEELDRRVNSGHVVEDEVLREYYLNLIKKWTYESLDSLEGEVRPALYFERNRGSDPDQLDASTSNQTTHVNRETITIVKNDLQKQVFGLGYPSRPTVTVDEFIDKKIKDGDLAFHAQKEIYANSLQRYAEKPDLRRDQEELSDAEHDEAEDRCDAEELNKKRRWDEFKDENPRGSGNRHNMG